MTSLQMVIDHKVGLHARPAALFVQEAQKFKSEVMLEFGGRSANAKSLLGILGLGVGSGSQIIVHADGDDAQQAVVALKQLVESNFGEGSSHA